VGRALAGVEIRLVNVNGDALVGDVGAPVDRLFAIADSNGDGALDAAEIRRHNLTDAGTVWILAADTDGDGMLSAAELAEGLPGFGDLQPRGGTQRASSEQIRRIRETTALATVAAYDVEEDGRLTLEEMRVYSSDFTRRSMGQTLVPIW
jgi:Ca2+-binding EF-hand superfamily protein